VSWSANLRCQATLAARFQICATPNHDPRCFRRLFEFFPINDDWTAAGTSPAGPHGSRFELILERQYQTSDPTVESAQNHDLCYQCHNRSFLTSDQAGTFPHNRHLATVQAPCAACHDAHGSRQNAHLIDFMLRDRSGRTVVSPSQAQGRLEYMSLGPGHGQCYLQCHGVNHEPRSY
jgi:hypothetical protein